jgi:hypothetical protein
LSATVPRKLPALWANAEEATSTSTPAMLRETRRRAAIVDIGKPLKKVAYSKQATPGVSRKMRRPREIYEIDFSLNPRGIRDLHNTYWNVLRGFRESTLARKPP